MTTRQELEGLVDMLRERAKETRQEAKDQDDFPRGLYNGYASAYELSAKWIEEILKNA